jgi:hypothetical protein
MLELCEEAEGVFSIGILRNLHVPPADPRIKGAVINWLERAMKLERSKSPLCLCCETEFYPGQAPAAFSILLPHRDDFMRLSLTGICRSCATRSDAVLAEALGRTGAAKLHAGRADAADRVFPPRRAGMSGARALAATPPGRCLWGIGRPPDDSFRFCGAPVEHAGAPYCQKHARAAYTRVVDVERYPTSAATPTRASSAPSGSVTKGWTECR